jgi:hypothetical protein
MFGGLLSRVMLIVETKKRRRDALIRKGDDAVIAQNKIIEDKLGKHLIALSKMKGAVVFDDDAIELFEHWYEIDWEEAETNPKTKTGIEGRMKTHIKKVAMALAMGEPELDLRVKKEHVDRAIDMCLSLYKNYQVIAAESGASPVAHPAALLIRILAESPRFEASRKTIIRRNLGTYSIEIIDQTVATLQGADLIDEVNANNEVSYRLTAKALEAYEGIIQVQKKVAIK